MAFVDDTLESVLAELLTYAQRQVFTALPGRIESYDAASQTANVSILVKDVLPVRTFPVLPSVPVQFPRATESGYFISFPIETGTTGLVIFTTLGIDRWRATGQLSEPTDARRNSITSAVFMPGLHSASDALSSVDPSAIVLGKEGGTPGLIALAAKVDQIISTLDTVFRTSWITAPNDGGAALKAAYAAAFPSAPLTVANADVKVS